VVRHHLVQRIIRAYDEHKTKLAEQQLSLLEPKTGEQKTGEQKTGANGKTNGSVIPPLQKEIAMSPEAQAKE
jgi:hypothetical protein